MDKVLLNAARFHFIKNLCRILKLMRPFFYIEIYLCLFLTLLTLLFPVDRSEIQRVYLAHFALRWYLFDTPELAIAVPFDG